MPLYEYQCDTCGHRFEVIQKFSDALVKVCPKCGAAVQKLISAPAFQLKGSGWYVTDYAKSGSGNTESKSEKSDKAESKAETKTETKSETKSETKPAAKPSDG